MARRQRHVAALCRSVISERIAELADGPFCYSRALAPDIRADLSLYPDTEELPLVRGTTVMVETESRPVVLGHPNHLGIFEPSRSGPTILICGRWSDLRPPIGSARMVVAEASVDRASADRTLDDARVLLKRLRQIRGVVPAWMPQSPILVMLLPNSGRPSGDTLGITTADLAYPELAGGLRIELDGSASTYALTRYAADLERAIIQEA